MRPIRVADRGCWPMGLQQDLTNTTLVIGLPRQVVVQRCRRADVDLVLRTTERCGLGDLRCSAQRRLVDGNRPCIDR